MSHITHNKSVSLWQLFLTFFKVGAFTFGGGYAMIAVLEEELVAKKKWITSADMLDMIVIAESTPGVIAVNSATSIGYRTRGVLGAILATLGVVLPSFLIIFGLSFAIQAFQQNVWYKAAFTGIQACVTVLVINAFVKMFKQINHDVFSYVLLVAAFGVAVFTRFNVIYLILIGGALGVVYTVICDAVKARKALPLEGASEPLQETSQEASNSHDEGSTQSDVAVEAASDVPNDVTSAPTSDDEGGAK